MSINELIQFLGCSSVFVLLFYFLYKLHKQDKEFKLFEDK